MSDVAALKAMLDFDTYIKFSPILFKLKNMQNESKMILRTIRLYYDTYKNQRNISVEELKTFFDLQNPTVKDPELFQTIFNGISSVSIENAQLLTDILKSNVEKHVMTQIGQVANDVVSATKPTGMEEVEKLLLTYKDITGTISDVENDVCNLSLTEILNQDKADGLSWKLKFLNRNLGPLKTASLGHVFARSNGGKTSFAVQNACYFAYQLHQQNSDRIVLYLNNEEDIGRVRGRAFNVVNNQNEAWLAANLMEAEKKYQDLIGDHLKFIGGVQHIDQVRRYMDAFNSRVVIIDQGKKVAISGKEEGTQRLQLLYNIYRTMANDYKSSLITIGQADSKADNQKWLTQNHLDSSKVDIPGELDWALGIGWLYDMAYKNVRFLNIAKNKGPDGREQIQFNPETSTYSD